ncbi:MAG TPA: hypothetical protein VFK78_06375 [Gemmatimonadales bacterium]|nr:hypothetical protein [Gemmatimonadales bacterium]
MTDFELEDRLRQAALHYHRPPETPREELWARIDAARAPRRGRGGILAFRPRLRWGIGIAAVLALGVGLGRLTVRAPAAAPVPARETNVALQLATAQYFDRTEAMLAGFRADAKTGRLDPTFVASAKDLLSTTRLMLDSPAAQHDPKLHALLDDLELVLAQITQLKSEPGSQDAEDIRFITQALEQRGVLLRLRAGVPAGPARAAAQGVL